MIFSIFHNIHDFIIRIICTVHNVPVKTAKTSRTVLVILFGKLYLNPNIFQAFMKGERVKITSIM